MGKINFRKGNKSQKSSYSGGGGVRENFQDADQLDKWMNAIRNILLEKHDNEDAINNFLENSSWVDIGSSEDWSPQKVADKFYIDDWEEEMYANGGQVEQKIKDKLAKGAFELPMELIVYVPSTKEANQIIPKSELQQRVKTVKVYLSNLFGGFSAAPIDGGYVSEDKDKGLIEEDAVKVTAFATKEALESNMSMLLTRIKKWCAQWSQESIGLEFEGDLFYVSKTSKFNNGGQAEDQDNQTMILRQAKEVAHHVTELNEILTKQPDIDAWVVAKMQDVTTQLSEVTHYLDSRVGFRLGSDEIDERMGQMMSKGGKTKFMKGGEIILGGGNMASVQDSIMARGAKLNKQEPYIDDRYPMSAIQSRLNDARENGYDAYVMVKDNELVLIIDQSEVESGDTRSVYWALKSYSRGSAAKGAKLKSSKVTLAKLKSMIEEYNKEGRNFELLGAYNQLELWSNDNRIEAGSKEDIYRALVKYRFNPKYAKGAKLDNGMSRSEKWMSTIKKFPNLNEEYPQLMNMSDKEIITFVNTYSYYDRMDEGIEEEFDDINDAIEYLVLINE
jgi:hypothetical protein